VSRYDRSFSDAPNGKYAAVLRRLTPGSVTLEVGCSTGYFSEYLKRAGHEVLGMEADPESAQAARAKSLDVIVANVEDPQALASIEGTFDAVLFMDVLEHLADPETALRRVRRVLRPGGRLLVTGPNVAYWAVRRNLLRGHWNYEETGVLDRTHLRFFTAVTWRALLEAAGYEVLALEPAEVMIPLESRLESIPLLRGFSGRLKSSLAAVWPALFTVVYFIEARPVE
jgi:2-polyprenyl-3-methyl-5-hydroxy-6-metoxy-1,4-benzoquinol methylase